MSAFYVRLREGYRKETDASISFAKKLAPRLFLVALGEPSLIVVGSIFLASNGLIVIVAWYDANCNNRLHPIFLYGGLGILLIRIARVPFAMSPIWRETAGFMSTLTS